MEWLPGHFFAIYNTGRVINSGDMFQMHKTEDTPTGAHGMHPMPLSVEKPVLKETVKLAEGANVQIMFVILWFWYLFTL